MAEHIGALWQQSRWAWHGTRQPDGTNTIASHSLVRVLRRQHALVRPPAQFSMHASKWTGTAWMSRTSCRGMAAMFRPSTMMLQRREREVAQGTQWVSTEWGLRMPLALLPDGKCNRPCGCRCCVKQQTQGIWVEAGLTRHRDSSQRSSAAAQPLAKTPWASKLKKGWGVRGAYAVVSKAPIKFPVNQWLLQVLWLRARKATYRPYVSSNILNSAISSVVLPADAGRGMKRANKHGRGRWCEGALQRLCGCWLFPLHAL